MHLRLRPQAAAALLALAACGGSEDRCEVHLKGGQVVAGEFLRDEAGAVSVRTVAGEELDFVWTLVRSVERQGQPDIFSVRFQPPAGAAAGGSGFIRFRPPRKGAAGALETAVRRLHEPAAGNDVFLVSVVHIGEETYFRRLQDILDSMDCVLFEGVRGGRSGEAASAGDRTATLDAIIKLQLLLKDALGLAYQKDAVDYGRAFWVNSDMSWDEVQARLDAQGLELIPEEKLVAFAGEILSRFVQEGITIPGGRAMRIRRIAAPLLGSAEKLFARLRGFEGLERVAIKARNDVVVRDLGEWLARSSGRRAAVFYGAGHMADLEAKVLEQHGLVHWGETWFEAWRVD